MNTIRLCGVLALLSFVAISDAEGATKRKHRPVRKNKAQVTTAVAKSVAKPTAKPAAKSARPTRSSATATAVREPNPFVQKTAFGSAVAPIIRGGPWLVPTYADSTEGDFIDGDDVAVRRAAVEALGNLNGTVIVADPSNGRVLTIVNQHLALGAGFQPCSTVKVAVSLAALSEKLVTAEQKVKVYGGSKMTMTYALAHSNNYYFAGMGMKMGFETFSKYAHQFGYGEKAGLNIQGEQAGSFPESVPANGGVGMLTSFGEEIKQTPLELAALMSAIANGGTMYYLQYPRSQQEIDHFIPQVKRTLPIRGLVDEIKPGLLGAVEYGTARRARHDERIAGKTGTCSNENVHLGWFGSFNDVGKNKLVVVVLLTGGRPAIGPAAAGVAGEIYKRLQERNYLVSTRPFTPASLVSTQICCSVK